jgi:glyoxylase-like metal-dependent hydrolase (beta-lactamase superfamily II)
MKKLHKCVYYHATSDGMNVGCVLGDDGIISIDLPVPAEEARAWRAQLAELSDKPLRAIVFTSPDRVSSEALAAISPMPGALSLPAFIHEAGFAQLYSALEASQPRALEPLTPVQLREHAVLPDATFTDGMTLVAGSASPLFVDVTFAGGYSPGSACVAVRDTGILFTGDLVAHQEPPSLAGANLDVWLEALANLRRNRKVTTLVPGRGPAGSPDIAAEAQAYLKAARAGVQRLVKARRERSDVSTLMPDLLALYAGAPGRARRGAAQAAADAETMARRVRAGLENLFDQMNQTEAPVAG